MKLIWLQNLQSVVSFHISSLNTARELLGEMQIIAYGVAVAL